MSHNLNKFYKKKDRYKAILDHGKGLLVINAGPGTGKTFCLIQKIGKLLDDEKDPNKIYYLTFANIILDAFKNDVKKSRKENGLGKSVEELEFHASTLHSLGFKVVKSYAKRLNLSELIEPVDLSPNSKSAISKIFFKDAYILAKASSKTNWYKFKKDIKKLTEFWQNNIQVEDRLKELEEIILKANQNYLAMPWDMLVPLANLAIDKYGMPRWLKDAEHFLIDEYQDFNPSEQRLIQLVSESSDSVVIVGDMDQSIYSGRSASPVGLKSLLQKKENHSVNFVYCRRCPKLVVKSANRVLSLIDPENYKSKKLIPFKKGKGYLKLGRYISCREEIDYIARLINYIKKKKGNAEIIMLFPLKKGIEYYKNELSKRGVKGFAESEDSTKEYLTAHLKIITFGGHTISERFLLSEYPSLEKMFRDKWLIEFMGGSSLDLIPVGRLKGSKRRTKAKDEWLNYKTRISNLKSRKPKLINEELIGAGVTNINIKTIEKLLEDISTRQKLSTLNAIIDEVAQGEESKNYDVHLLTMHGSKGLSKDWVIIPAFEDKWLPGGSKEEALIEKHRLFYVSITRSKEGVLITYPRTRARGDPLNYPHPNTSEGISRYSALIG